MFNIIRGIMNVGVDIMTTLYLVRHSEPFKKHRGIENVKESVFDLRRFAFDVIFSSIIQ